MNLFENIIAKGNIPGTSSLFNSVSSNPQITGNTGGGITPQSLSQAKSSIDVANQIKQKYGFNDKDIQFLRLAKEKGYDSQKAMEYLQNRKKPENQNIYKGEMSNPIFNVVGGAVAEVPNVIGQTASFLSKAGQYTPTGLLATGIKAGFSDKTFGELMDEQTAEANKFAELGGKGKAFVQKYGAYDPTSFGSKSGEFVTDIGSSLIGPNKVGLLKKGGQIIGAGKKLTTGAKIGDIALEGGLAGAKYDVATKGEITPESVGIGALANVGFAGAIKGVGKAYEGVTKRLPASLTLGGLINPGKLDVVKKALQVDEGVATPEDVGKWILDRVKPGNKQEIAQQLIQHAEKTKGAVDEALGSIPTYFQNPTAKKALLQIRAELEGKVGLEGKLAKIDELLDKPDYTLSELNAIKRELDDMYNLYTKTGDPTAGLKAEGLRNVRANLRKFIEDEAEKYGVNIRKLNNETATARGLADGILRKDSSESVRELLTDFAPSGAGAVVGAGQAIARGEDPLTVLRDALIGGVATRVATSTAIRTRIASALNRLAPRDLTALENYIRSGGKDAIGKKVAEKVIQEGRALPARTITKPEDFAKTPEKAIITPQTQERAIIQESKKGLSSNVKRPNGNTNNTSSNSRVLPVGSKKVQKPSPQVKPVEKTSATQANGPRVLGKMGKLETKTTLKSPTSFEEGMRRPFTMGNNKPIVKRASDVGIGTIESSKNIGAKIITSDGLPIYHGTSKSNAQSIKSKGLQILPEGRNNLTGEGSYGVSFSIDKNIGKKYADVHGGEVIEMKMPKGAKILQIDSKGNGIDETFTYNELETLSKKYEAILDISEGQEKEIRVLKNISKPLSPQKTVKPLTPKKQSATMGDMETKKLIEEARKAKDFASFFMKKLGSKEVNKKNLLKLGISSEQIERNTFSNGISLEDIFYELKSGKLSSYPIK